jgi:hypothetical protein
MSGTIAPYGHDFNLHSLGWKAFQDLCATILTAIMQRPVQVFSPTNDRGRDATFQGASPEAGTYAVQCKFTSRRDATLSLSDVQDEIAKVSRLASKGLADNYILMTNYSVSGAAEEVIRAAFLAISGVNTFELYGSHWINLQIAENKKLRALVPRLYGLGDLSQILDERAYTQAREILTSMGDDLAKLVVTRAQQQSAEALIGKGFVLLLGDPASGKSTIAAGLSVAAIDMWSSRPLKLVDPGDFRTHWNPDDPEQFFWFDDAFGTTQYQRDLAEQWNRTFPHIKAAIAKGARILLTSRTYIYERAILDLKTESFPLIRDSQVVIRVYNLSLAEKSQMLYNHVKLGSQPKEFKQRIRPYLPAVAGNKAFLPETARRLGNPAFTKTLALCEEPLRRFVENPVPLLLEVIRSADTHTRAALAVIFMSGGTLASPIEITEESRGAIRRLGSNEPNLLTAIESLKGSLVKLVQSESTSYWTFQHPTVRDAFATYVAMNPELVDIYLVGTPVKQLVEEVVCGPIRMAGAKVTVPKVRYPFVIDRLSQLEGDHTATFLMTRCDRDFAEQFLRRHPNFLNPLSAHRSYSIFFEFGKLAKHLARLSLLPERARADFAACVAATVTESGDLEPLIDEEIRSMLTDGEIAALEEFAKTDLLAKFDDFIYEYAEDWEKDTNPENAFDTLSRSLEIVEELGGLNGDQRLAVESARSNIEDEIEQLREAWNPEPEPDYEDLRGGSVGQAVDSSMFSDVAE